MDYIEIDVESGRNSDLSITRIFEPLDASREVSWIETAFRPDGWEGECDVTGWSSNGPIAARAVMVTASGDGAVVLIYGGDQGIRLRPSNSNADWDLDDPQQWGEPCLMLEPTVGVS